MLLNKLNFQENLYSLTATELRIAEEFIVFNKHLLSLEFDTTIKDYKDIVNTLNTRKLSDKHGFIYAYFIAVKAIIIMKENWAKTIDELDKLYLSSKAHESSESIEEQNTKITTLQKEAEEQQKQDFEESKLLSEHIKNGKIDE